MDQDFDAVVAGELELLDPEIRGNSVAARALLHHNFREFGSSGAVWDRETIVQATSDGTVERITVDDLRPLRLGPDAILLTYTAHKAHTASLRTSVWVRGENRWLLLHHQGTDLPTDEQAAR